MPDPYKGNDKAACLLDYYASDRMLRHSVHRLHHQAIQEKKLAIQRIEEEVYPKTPRVVRTPEEMDRYLKRRVTEEMLLRQQRNAARERAYYPERFDHGPQLREEDLAAQVERLYTPATPSHKVVYQPIRHRDPILGFWEESADEDEGVEAAAAGQEGEQEDGADVRAGRSHSRGEKTQKRYKSRSGNRGQRSPRGERDVWRPTYGHMDRESPTLLEQLYSPPPRRKTGPVDPEVHMQRIRLLSKPLRVTPKSEFHKSKDDSAKPLFKVPRKIEHHDAF